MINKLILGTVQFGLNYGINNTIGKLDKVEVFKLLKIAYNKGIRFLDTAELYGDAHEIIGDYHKKNYNNKFRVITKFPNNIEINRTEDKVLKYLEILDIKSISVIMFHSFDSFKSNYKVLKLLNELKKNGIIDNIGVSVYTNSQLENLLNEDLISVVQLPFNLLDNLNFRGDLLYKLKIKGKSIHTRSVFLQGLFFKKINDQTPIVQKLKNELKFLNKLITQSNCSMEELALSYSLNQENIDNVIIGVDSISQLNDNLEAASFVMNEETLKQINNIKVKNIELLNPSLWS